MFALLPCLILNLATDNINDLLYICEGRDFAMMFNFILFQGQHRSTKVPAHAQPAKDSLSEL